MKMRFIYGLIFIILSVCCFTSTNAISQLRQKRAMGFRRCPENLTHKECEDFAKEKVKGRRCVRYYVSKGFIRYASCGVVSCYKPLIKVQDLTKPHPQCCPTCILPL